LDEWEENPFPHILFEAFPLIGLNMFSICFDMMHVLEKGVLDYFCGSAIWTLVHESGLPGVFHGRTAYVWDKIRAAWDHLEVPSSERLPREEFYHVFGTQTSAKPSSQPMLAGKAAHARHLVPALRIACEQITIEQGLERWEDRQRLECLRLLEEFYDIVVPEGHYLPEASAVRVKEIADEFLIRQNHLHALYGTLRPEERQLKHYQVTFKSHLFWHMADWAKWFNPRAGWCYGNERFVGKIARITRSVVMGGGAIHLGQSLPTKWIHLQHFRMRRRENAVYA